MLAPWRLNSFEIPQFCPAVLRLPRYRLCRIGFGLMPFRTLSTLVLA
ncbi:MAG: hypothetical protein ACJA1E_000600 [Paracoccaceae bacterium]|jgi:hypothetical protein